MLLRSCPSRSTVSFSPTTRLSGLRPLVALCLLGFGLTAAAAQVLTGIDVLEAERFSSLRGKRVGLLSNPTGINRRGVPTWKILRAAPGVKLVALFGAEHGFDGTARAGIEVRDAVHKPTGLPIHSLYGPGPVRQPTARMLEGLDALVYDIQDTGCRSYTFISSLGLAMEACASRGIEFFVLDRPNPLGGQRVEGPGLDPKFKSFVGQWPMPYVYGMTPGELARMIAGEGWISGKCRVSVVPLRGWSRTMTWNDTRLTWIPSSPNVPRGDTPLYLVATGVLGEIGGVNLGTGSRDSFRIVGAPWLNPAKFAKQLNGYALPGLAFEPVEFDFNRNKADGTEFRGVRLRFTEPATAPIAAVNFYLLEAIRKTTGQDLFRKAIDRGKSWNMFDKVTGSDSTRKAMQSGRSAREIAASWKSGEDAFRNRRRPYLIYPEPKAGTASSAIPSSRSTTPTRK
ncbi:MAG: exo-beta-N-acetylmuramidase NamZ domain-containing protein [Limisphaerales bacterium]